MDISINYPAVLAAAAAAFVLGFLWHGPLFGNIWIKLMGIPQAEVDAAKAKGMGAMMPQMTAAVVQQIVLAAVLSNLMENLGIIDAMGAVVLAFLVWLGFIATTLLNGVLWEKRTMNLYLFNIVYHLVSLILIALVIFWMS
jgi:hypothetical protein